MTLSKLPPHLRKRSPFLVKQHSTPTELKDCNFTTVDAKPERENLPSMFTARRGPIHQSIMTSMVFGFNYFQILSHDSV